MIWTLLWLASVIAIFIFGILLVRAIDARRMEDLEEWHRGGPRSEYTAPLPFAKETFRDFLEREDLTFRELEDFFIRSPERTRRDKYSRYAVEGANNPCRFPENWNRTIELVPEEIQGGILLLHGLTDSPYSLRSLAEFFFEKGYYVLAPRLPGHGTTPGALLSVSFRDWTHVVDLAAEEVTRRLGADLPFLIGGYSNGGALSLNYTLNSLLSGRGRTPDRLILLSPAVAITSLARVTSWHRFLSWMPWFEKNKWLRIEPEFDPYKYNSTPQNAAAQTWFLTVGVRSKLHLATKKKVLDRFPPVLTFQSVVDATINERAIPSVLYDRMPENGGELVLFDINNLAPLEGLFTREYRNAIRHFESREDLRYTLTVVTNLSEETPQVEARTTPPRSSEVVRLPLDLEWPRQVYSLAHVSIPFPGDDPIYGPLTPGSESRFIRIGGFSFRGEMGVLSLSSDQLMRLRYNPFHSYMMERINDWISIR